MNTFDLAERPEFGSILTGAFLASAGVKLPGKAFVGSIVVLHPFETGDKALLVFPDGGTITVEPLNAEGHLILAARAEERKGFDWLVDLQDEHLTIRAH